MHLAQLFPGWSHDELMQLTYRQKMNYLTAYRHLNQSY